MESQTPLPDAGLSKPRDVHAYRAGVLIRAHLFLATTVGSLALWHWPQRWLISGAPVLTYILWLGEATGYRVLPFVPFWTVASLINLTYAVATTSWLLFGIYLPLCYMATLISCLCQFELASNFTRSSLGSILAQLHFINDKIAFFNIPALEIDTEVEGLLVIRGLTLSLLHLSLVAHGVEVGIKLSDDMELSLQVDEVEIKLFRRVEIGDVYGNLKGGEYEMTFGSLADATTASTDGASLMVSDTPLLLAAAKNADTRQPEVEATKEKLTNGDGPVDVSAKDAAASLTQVNLDKDKANSRYAAALKHIDETSSIRQARQQTDMMASRAPNADSRTFDPSNSGDMRAAICSELHDKPSVPHPPTRSVKVTTLQNLTAPKVRKFMHRLPFLLRLLLNPIAYFHTIHIKAITVGGSGKWLQHMLHEMVFRDYLERATGVTNLERRLSAWLSDANFVVEIANIVGMAQVPLSTAFDITTQLRVDDVMAYRTLPAKVDLKQVVRLGGADASITVPSFLLPHHEHILPPLPTEEVEREKETQVAEADGIPKQIQAQHDLEQTRKDETNLTLSVHARLPAVFDQELLNFVAALIKATKIIEMDPGPDSDHSELVEDSGSEIDVPEPKKRGFREMTRTFQTDLAKGMRRVAIDAVTNDRWIAKLVGKSIRRLESAKGDVGYTGLVPISLESYRKAAEEEIKLLP
ncbi:hypothetical protein H2200_009029 [Cladophialophora chaetospira]|uniref:Uncharacterized protein n=1 Tax=Cladophialophora chaetospira TaxID=386627 RepID=A0AA39CF02_9EURO|nr:hypothetical protein H2200_009029 [Cladophialophora chaetospira]